MLISMVAGSGPSEPPGTAFPKRYSLSQQAQKGTNHRSAARVNLTGESLNTIALVVQVHESFIQTRQTRDVDTNVLK